MRQWPSTCGATASPLSPRSGQATTGPLQRAVGVAPGWAALRRPPGMCQGGGPPALCLAGPGCVPHELPGWRHQCGCRAPSQGERAEAGAHTGSGAAAQGGERDHQRSGLSLRQGGRSFFLGNSSCTESSRLSPALPLLPAWVLPFILRKLTFRHWAKTARPMGAGAGRAPSGRGRGRWTAPSAHLLMVTANPGSPFSLCPHPLTHSPPPQPTLPLPPQLVLAGHDWGGNVCWAAAYLAPHLYRKLAILAVPHPKCYMANMDWDQFRRSWQVWHPARPLVRAVWPWAGTGWQ